MNRCIGHSKVVITNNYYIIADLQAQHTSLLSLFQPVVTTLAVAITHTNNYSSSQFEAHYTDSTRRFSNHTPSLRRPTSSKQLSPAANGSFCQLPPVAILATIHWTTDSLVRSFPLITTDWIQLGRSTDTASERSERTRWRHRLRHLFYCRITYHIIITQQTNYKHLA
jgi:hypothetical protein